MGDAEEYDPDKVDLDDEDKGLGGEGYEPFRENIIFLVDAQAAMFRNALTDQEEFKDDVWFDVALKVIQEFLKTHIIAAPNDQVAVIFYGTRETKNLNAFENVYTFMDLDVPDARRIRSIRKLVGGGFQREIGSASSSRPDHLRYALWTASQLLAGGSKASKRIMIFTNSANPIGVGDRAASYREQVLSRAADLHESGVRLELYPMIGLGQDFDMAFWRQALRLDDSARLSDYEASEVMYRLASLKDTMKVKAFKKRAQASVRWMFPGGFTLSLSLYSLLQPASKPGYIWLWGKNNEPLRSETALICDDTGAVLTDVNKHFFPAKPNDRLPRVIIDADELRELKAIRSPGLRLLGFKPRAALRDWHQLRPSSFLYPDERDLQGSTTAFIALHSAMLDQDRFALCSFVRSANAEPRLVALLPGREVRTEDDYQLEPPGMHMVYLPYADDLRAPETDPSFVGTMRKQASPEQVEAAMHMVEKLTLHDFTVGAVPNPNLQRFYTALEALALDEEPPAEIPDETLPDTEGMARVAPEIRAFKEAVYGPGWDEDIAPVTGKGKAVAGAKRKAPAAGGGAAPNSTLAADVAEMDVPALAKEGQLSTLTVADLKKYCEAAGLAKSGKKADLVDRISQHLAAAGS